MLSDYWGHKITLYVHMAVSYIRTHMDPFLNHKREKIPLSDMNICKMFS